MAIRKMGIQRTVIGTIAAALPMAMFLTACGGMPDDPASEAVTESAASSTHHIMIKTPGSYPSVLVTTWDRSSNTPHPKCVRVTSGVWSGSGISVAAHTWVDFNVHTDSACQSARCCAINHGAYSPGPDGLLNWWVDLK